MATELSLQSVRDFLLDKGGIVRNKDLVRHFKEFVNNPATKAQAREKFKEFVNTLCSISSNEQNDKLLVLKTQYLARDDLPYGATSAQLQMKSSVAAPQFDLASPGQDACAQAIASARAIQEGFSLIGSSPMKPRRSAPRPPSHPKVLLGEFGVVTGDEGEMMKPVMSGENGNTTEVISEDVPHYSVSTDSETLPEVSITASSPPPVVSPPPEGGDQSPSLMTQMGSMLDNKFSELQRGRPSKLIKERAEAMARSGAVSPDQHNLSQVMVSVAAKAAALAEKPSGSDDEEEVKKLPLQPHTLPTNDRMAATVLNLGEPIVPMSIPSTDVPDGGQHSVARKPETSSNSERMKVLLDSFQHSASLQDTVKQGTSSSRPRSRTVDSSLSPVTSHRWASSNMSPTSPGQLSPFFTRNGPQQGQGPRASLQTRIRKKERETKDGAGNKQESLRKQERKESTRLGMNNVGSDGEDSGDEDDDQGFDSSHVVLDPIEREWLPCSASGVTDNVRQMLQRDESLANKKDFINTNMSREQYTGLHWAAKIGNEEMLKLLLDFGADINVKTGQTALHLAARHGHEDIVFTLIEDYFAEIYTRDYAGRQPRDIVKANASQDVKEILDCRVVERDVAHTLSSDGVMKCTNGSSSVGDLTDFDKPPLKQKQSFRSSILRASLRRLKGSKDEKKRGKSKIEISVMRPENADWLREAPIKQSASEGNIKNVDL